MTRLITNLLAAAVAVALARPAALQACATCFGASDSGMAQGMNMGILSLLGVIGTVLAGVAGFFVFLAWRLRRRPAADVTAAAAWAGPCASSDA
jgi:heme/copper-type cytochrome/quinol oxidase subunit 2